MRPILRDFRESLNKFQISAISIKYKKSNVGRKTVGGSQSGLVPVFYRGLIALIRVLDPL